jgi:hypothetical protein
MRKALATRNTACTIRISTKAIAAPVTPMRIGGRIPCGSSQNARAQIATVTVTKLQAMDAIQPNLAASGAFCHMKYTVDIIPRMTV